jgi:hypothetical protein
MNPPTDKKRQWLWFVLLWLGGLLATLALSYGYRWLMAHI